MSTKKVPAFACDTTGNVRINNCGINLDSLIQAWRALQAGRDVASDVLAGMLRSTYPGKTFGDSFLRLMLTLAEEWDGTVRMHGSLAVLRVENLEKW